MKVHSLQFMSRDVVLHWLCSWPMEKPPDILAIYQYLLPATPLLADLAHSCQYYSYPYLTQLFLPVLIPKGKLHITAANMKQVVDYWKNGKHEHVSSITHLKVEEVEGMQYFSFLPLLGHLTNLQVLIIGSLVNDDLLAVLGINCPHLIIFDAREDTGNSVTDVGLAYLAQCKKLKRIYFSMFADEYDCSTEQLGFLGKGVALLLLLPVIEHVQCSEYLLRDALHFLYQASYQRQTLSVQCMLMDHPEVSVGTLQIMPILCPKLEVVSLHADSGNERIIGKSLKMLSHLKMLVITMASVCKFQDLSLPSYGPQLIYLCITTYLLDSTDISLLSQSCSQLKTLVLKMYSFGFDGMSTNMMNKPLFPTVEKLELVQNISVRLFRLLNIKMENLKEVHCVWATVHNLDEALKVVVKEGGWKNTEVLVLPSTTIISITTAQMVAAMLPNLKHLAVNVHPSEENRLCSFIKQNVPSVTLVDHFPNLSPSTTGIFSQDIWSSDVRKERKIID
ncbi:uncharacterized protein [Panulirus ornatus]|uniref:uncharacterized protein n=1 Tax=Panulirus ornatus TaxID=150431 RepID=UPI003A8BE8CA